MITERNNVMIFDEAKRFKMPFGVYEGKTLSRIARSRSGLQYLELLQTELSTYLEKQANAADGQVLKASLIFLVIAVQTFLMLDRKDRKK